MAKLFGALLRYGVPILVLIIGVQLVWTLTTGLLFILGWPYQALSRKPAAAAPPHPALAWPTQQALLVTGGGTGTNRPDYLLLGPHRDRRAKPDRTGERLCLAVAKTWSFRNACELSNAAALLLGA